ncbi:hypothetical protein [Sphingomonas sp.]|uniref:hypothetical protein n=1 Tax=Sphingomonas sp. TaxID=28214 RepID=UPI002ED8FC85
MLAGGFVRDRLGARDRDWYARLPAICSLIALPLFAIGILSRSSTVAFLASGVPHRLVYVWLAPVVTAVQHLVPAHMRARASATFLLGNNLIGLGAGTMLLGTLSDAMPAQFGGEALRYAMLAGLGLYILAGLLMWAASSALR